MKNDATTAETGHSPMGFRVIGAMKLASALMLAAAGFGIFRMINRDIGASLDALISRLHLDPENRLIHDGVARVAGLDNAQLKAIGAGTFFYALLHLVEGTGLVLLKPWAEYLTVIATGSLLPLELYEVARKPTPIRIGILVFNAAILVYLVVKLRQQHKAGKKAAAASAGAERPGGRVKLGLMDRADRGILLAGAGEGSRTRPTRCQPRAVVMRKVLFEVPALGLKLPSFGASLALACFAALFLTAWRATRERLNPETVFDLAVWLMSGGFIGARVLFLATHPESVRSFADVFKLWQGGIVFYGCILGGLIGSVIFWARHPFPFRPMADAVAPSLAVGSAVGRVGCFLNGCCYGDVTGLPWGLSFPAGSLPWARHVHEGLISLTDAHSLPVQPTQIFAAFDGFLILALLTAYYPRRRRDGEVMALLMFSYSITRFIEEALRGDEPALLAGLTISQWISVAVFVGGVALWVYLSRLPVGRYADGSNSGPHFAAAGGSRLSTSGSSRPPGDTTSKTTRS